MAADTFVIEVEIDLKDNASGALKGMSDGLSGYEKAMQKAESTLGKFSGARAISDAFETAGSKALSAIGTISQGVKGVASIIGSVISGVGSAISYGADMLGLDLSLQDTIDTYSDFSSTMSRVEAISGATAGQMDTLTSKAKEMGASTKFTATEAGEAFTYMAMAGWNSQQMLDGIDGIMALAAADGLDLATTSDIVTDALTAFGLSASDSGHFADVLATASSNANTNVSMLGESFKYVAPVAGSLGFSIEDTALALGLMANAGIKGSMAGTALRGALSNLLSPSDNAAKVMDKYGITLDDGYGNAKSLMTVMEDLRGTFGNMGIELTNAEGDLKDYDQIMQDLQDSGGDTASQIEKLSDLSTLFGVRALPGMLSVIQAGQEDFDSLRESIYNADGAAQRMSETMLDNLSGSMTILQSAVEGVKLELGERLSPYLRSAVEWLTEKMPAVQDAVGVAFDYIDDKAAGVKRTIAEFTSGEDWANADFLGKVSIAWDKLIAEPFDAWWEGGGKASLTEGIGDLGQDLGGMLSGGIMTLLGVDTGGAVSDGVALGKAFAGGFMDGFDLSGVAKGLGNVALEHPILAAAAGLYGGSKLVSTVGKLGGGSLVKGLGTGLSALGGGSMLAGAGYAASGITAGTALISGGLDIYRARNAENDLLSEGYGASAISKVGGTALGAAIGTMILPGVGTLVGAGIGGLAGLIGGGAIQRHYEQKAEDQRLAELSKEAERYASQDLRNAYTNSEVSDQEFEALYHAKVMEGIAEHFGDIKLSASEVSDLASAIMRPSDSKAMEDYAAAAANTNNALITLKGTRQELDKEDWKIGLGMDIGKDEMAAYQTALESFSAEAQQYMQNAHYEVTKAVGENSRIDIDALNRAFQGSADDLDALDLELKAKVSLALEDGNISPEELQGIQGIRDQIEAITQEYSQTEADARLRTAELQFSGGGLSSDSFTDVASAAKDVYESQAQMYDSQYDTIARGLALAHNRGELSDTAYQEQTATAYMENLAQKGAAALSLAGWEMNTLADAYGEELGGQSGQALLDGMERGFSSGYFGEHGINAETLSDWFGLGDLKNGNMETWTGLTDMLSSIADSLPDNFAEMLGAMEALEVDVPVDVNAEAENATVTGLDEAIDGAEEGSNATIDVPVDVNAEAETATVTGLDEAIDSAGEGSNATIDVPVDVNAEAETVDIPVDVNAEVENATVTGLDEAITSEATGPFSALTSVDLDTTWNVTQTPDSAIQEAAAGPFSASTTVTLNVTWNVTPPPDSAIQAAAGGSHSASTSASVSGHAEGGFLNHPELSLVGEDGPEYIIPVGSKRRSRGIALWEEAGMALGVSAYADGGFVGTGPVASSFTDEAFPAASTAASTQPVQVSVTLAPNINVDAGVGEQSVGNIVETVKQVIAEATDDIAEDLAKQLSAVFSNMTV